jgi:hypothetical protein
MTSYLSAPHGDGAGWARIIGTFHHLEVHVRRFKGVFGRLDNAVWINQLHVRFGTDLKEPRFHADAIRGKDLFSTLQLA